jgi:hypothetical protein
MNKDFFILKIVFDSKIFIFFGKNKWLEKNQNGGQNSRWRQVDYFFNRNAI